MVLRGGDHITLNVDSSYNQDPTKKSKSLRRLWRQLSRCQRSTIYIFGAFIICGLFYVVTDNDAKTSVVNQPEDVEIPKKDVLVNMRNDPRDVDNELPPNIGPQENHVLEEPEDTRNVDINVNNLSPHIFSSKVTKRQEAVIDAFKHAWKGYKTYAWGHDHLKPISEGYHDWFGLGLSIVDSLDTIYIMGLKNEFQEARDWVDKHLHFDINRDVNLFEVTIRVLGGLLSIYHLSGDRMFLNKAIDLGDRLLPCFESESSVPFSDINLFTRKAHAPKWSPDSSTSEVTTIQLEFRDLSRASGNPKYEKVVANVSRHVHGLEKTDGLVPIFINANTGQFRSYSTITLGARGDSYYEYLLKQWVQTGKTMDYLRDDYMEAISGVEKHLAKRTAPNGFLFIGELLVGGKDFKPKMDHLTCYLPGTLALGTHVGLPNDHLKLAEELLTTCYQTYAQQPTFLAPEITYFNIQGENSNDMYVKSNDAHNLLRPEFIESLWYMYQFTGNSTYQDWGWQIFQAFEKYTRVANGYTSIGNVKNAANVRPKDMMESFFLSETLKYLYLLFSDDTKLLDLDKFVINSEAHPLPIYQT
ncbi:PREDICTED: endoplasmic reticulum mannosyl-oligosaccharide 1,2-alpha-mannosidase [Nicrophorus vespilloides]|uniref:alpha-1,2-Mannosidase n=1 Tax=Nicrophorus vespilloides TaxID=110193 RepID=A0ABM1MYZ5_NICVS|nr:PREDICTED: endoplasmic reticulum mannosyl-oligosaccharide 1,2-alpha-mannosidase [Nicrophorus vespilloides]